MSLTDLVKDVESDVSKLNPASIVADLESAKSQLTAFKTRISELESNLGTLLSAVQAFVPLVEAAFPQAAPEITAALAAIRTLSTADAVRPPGAK